MSIHCTTIQSYNSAGWRDLRMILKMLVVAMPLWSREQNLGLPTFIIAPPHADLHYHLHLPHLWLTTLATWGKFCEHFHRLVGENCGWMGATQYASHHYWRSPSFVFQPGPFRYIYMPACQNILLCACQGLLLHADWILLHGNWVLLLHASHDLFLFCFLQNKGPVSTQKASAKKNLASAWKKAGRMKASAEPAQKKAQACCDTWCGRCGSGQGRTVGEGQLVAVNGRTIKRAEKGQISGLGELKWRQSIAFFQEWLGFTQQSCGISPTAAIGGARTAIAKWSSHMTFHLMRASLNRFASPN